MSDWLTVATVAETLGVSRRTVERWIAAGQLPAYRFPNGLTRVSQGEFTVFVEQASTIQPRARRRHSLSLVNPDGGDA